MINILCVTCLFIFFITFSNKTDGQTLDTEIRFVFLGTEGVVTKWEFMEGDILRHRVL